MGIVFLDATQKEVHKPDDEEIHWRVSAYAVIRNVSGEILMVKPFWNDQWELPGGGIEVDETLEEGVVRECLEETGYRVKPISLIPLHTGEQFFKGIKVKSFFHSVYFFYEARLLDFPQDVDAINPDGFEEIRESAWVSIDDINDKNCHPVHFPAIRMLRDT